MLRHSSSPQFWKNPSPMLNKQRWRQKKTGFKDKWWSFQFYVRIAILSRYLQAGIYWARSETPYLAKMEHIFHSGMLCFVRLKLWNNRKKKLWNVNEESPIYRVLSWLMRHHIFSLCFFFFRFLFCRQILYAVKMFLILCVPIDIANHRRAFFFLSLLIVIFELNYDGIMKQKPAKRKWKVCRQPYLVWRVQFTVKATKRKRLLWLCMCWHLVNGNFSFLGPMAVFHSVFQWCHRQPCVTRIIQQNLCTGYYSLSPSCFFSSAAQPKNFKLVSFVADARFVFKF